MSINRSRESSYAKHRREMVVQVYLPLVITALLLILVPVGIVILLTPYQVGTVSAFMSLLLLIPAVLVCIMPYVLLVALASLLHKLNRWLPGRFDGILSVIQMINRGAYQAARRVASPIIWANQRYAWLEHMVSSRTQKIQALLPRSTGSDEQ